MSANESFSVYLIIYITIKYVTRRILRLHPYLNNFGFFSYVGKKEIHICIILLWLFYCLSDVK